MARLALLVDERAVGTYREGAGLAEQFIQETCLRQGAHFGHRIRGPQMLPVLARELVERHHPLPVAIERARGLGMAALRAPRLERSLLPRGLLSGLGVRNSREQTPRFGLLLERQLVEEVQEAVIPASLLLRLREDGSQRAQMPRCPSPTTTFGA